MKETEDLEGKIGKRNNSVDKDVVKGKLCILLVRM